MTTDISVGVRWDPLNQTQEGGGGGGGPGGGGNNDDYEFDYDGGNSSSRLFERSRICLLYTSPSPRDGLLSRMPSSA